MSRLTVERCNVKRMDPSVLERIDEFTEQHGGTVFHESALNIMASEAYGTELSYFLAHIDGSLAGCMPCHSFRERGLTFSHSNLSSYELPYGGWVFDKELTDIDELLARTSLGSFESLQVKTNIEEYPGQQTGNTRRKMTKLTTVLVDLTSGTPAELFEEMRHNQKQKIRRATKLGVETYMLRPEDFEVFSELGSELKSKACLKQRDNQFYKQVFSHYQKLGRAACTIARYRGENISAGMMLANSNYCIGWLAGRKIDIPNNLYQNELLLWDQIRWAMDQGCRYFDLGAIDEIRLPHLMRIKLSFSKEIRSFYSFRISMLPFRVLNRIRKLL